MRRRPVFDDMSPLPNGQCGRWDGLREFWCTLRAGHEGDHISYNTTRPAMRWAQGDVPAATSVLGAFREEQSWSHDYPPVNAPPPDECDLPFDSPLP